VNFFLSSLIVRLQTDLLATFRKGHKMQPPPADRRYTGDIDRSLKPDRAPEAAAISSRGIVRRRLLLATLLSLGVMWKSKGSAKTTIVIENGVGETTITDSGNSPIVVANDEIRTEERRPQAYSGIKLDIPAELTFAPSSATFLRITGPSNILPLVTSETEDEELVIGLAESVSLRSPIRIVAGSPQLNVVNVAGSGMVKAVGLSGRPLRLSLSGSGSITAAGKAETVDVRISGSGDVDASAVSALRLIAEISGAGSLRASATRGVVADISGSGAMVVRGDPAERKINVAGSGRVHFQ
jgi:Putative auto-transporter adhesin, head GIN domain